MCCGCYKEYGSPLVVTDLVYVAAFLKECVYSFSASGGHLHCLLDDFNIEDDFCHERWIDEAANDPDADPLQIAVERACVRVFAAMTMDERATTLGGECLSSDQMASIGQKFRPSADIVRAIEAVGRAALDCDGDAERTDAVIGALDDLERTWRESL